MEQRYGATGGHCMQLTVGHGAARKYFWLALLIKHFVEIASFTLSPFAPNRFIRI